MPFGLTNAPGSWQEFINNVLREFLDITVTVYLDDILIYSKNKETHTEDVKKVLDKLREHHLYVELEKCDFSTTEIEFLGSILSTTGVRMDSKKVQAVLDWPQPKNVKDLQAFLGLANYYRRFIKNYSKIAGPLFRFTKKGQPFQWDNDAETMFQTLKQAFTTAPILGLFDPAKPLFLETDASDYALGACLS